MAVLDHRLAQLQSQYAASQMLLVHSVAFEERLYNQARNDWINLQSKRDIAAFAAGAVGGVVITVGLVGATLVAPEIMIPLGIVAIGKGTYDELERRGTEGQSTWQMTWGTIGAVSGINGIIAPFGYDLGGVKVAGVSENPFGSGAGFSLGVAQLLGWGHAGRRLFDHVGGRLIPSNATVAHDISQFRATDAFLRTEGILDPALRRSIIDAGFARPLGADTPVTLARFRKLFPDTIQRGKAFSGRLGDIETRVATINEAAAMERSGLIPRFEFRVSSYRGNADIDLVGIDPVTRQPVRAVQFIRAIPRAGGLLVFDYRETVNSKIIDQALGRMLLEFYITGP
jgi:hypothetical protein